MEKDITTNNLIDNDDVFADIANVNIFDGVRLIAPEDLESVPTGSSYRDLDGSNDKEECDTMCLLLDMCEEEGIQKGIQQGVSLAKQILQLNAKGETAEEIADQLDVEMTMVEDILDFN